MLLGRTGIIYNGSTYKPFGVEPYGYRCRGCNKGLSGNTPADQYQKQKLIQNTVRVYSSLYTMNLGSLSSYERPTVATYLVGWNQQSDRPYPSVQKASIPTGFNTSMNGRHHSNTSSKPGSQTPGGIGCDIKHNSYDRYLNKLKGRKVLRRGVIPPTFGLPYIPFNRAFPVYGGKTTKTNIVNNCNCPIGEDLKQDLRIYNDPLWQPYPTSEYGFSVGSYVYAIQTGNDFYTRAIVTNISDSMYTIKFDNGTVQTVNVSELKVYFPCNCNGAEKYITFSSGTFVKSSSYSGDCILPQSTIVQLV